MLSDFSFFDDKSDLGAAVTVEMLTIGGAEHVDAIVELSQPGVWILGSIDEQDRCDVMRKVVECAGKSGAPPMLPLAQEAAKSVRWMTRSSAQGKAPEPTKRIKLQMHMELGFKWIVKYV